MKGMFRYTYEEILDKAKSLLEKGGRYTSEEVANVELQYISTANATVTAWREGVSPTVYTIDPRDMEK